MKKIQPNVRWSVTRSRAEAIEKTTPRIKIRIPLVPIALLLVCLKLAGVLTVSWTTVGIILGVLALPLLIVLLIAGAFFVSAAVTLLFLSK
jgi:hypothetical protein